jgi:diaminopimelate epimerase
MQIEFYKYQGTGNDFIFIDNRNQIFSKNDTNLVAGMCDRKFGIGADGLILLEVHPSLDFTMTYYNADGNLSSMCGNGGRCIVHFASFLGIITSEATFEAVDGVHEARIEGDTVSLKMNDVSEVTLTKDVVFLDTGSPHHVTMVDDLDHYDVYSEGKKIRNALYGNAGANVNFVAQEAGDIFSVRTYERGVEDETLSCGTGVTAVAIGMHAMGKTASENIILKTPGGTLEVSFQYTKSGYINVYLKGPAEQVFKGYWQ